MKIILKLAKGLLLIAPWVLSILLFHILSLLDHSGEPPTQLSGPYKTTNIHLISYADGPTVFAQNQNMLAMSAVNRGIDFIYNYRRNNIDPAFVQANPVLNRPMGAGYWLWKPYLILETLKKIPQGDILIYADTGLLFRQNIRAYFIEGLQNKDILFFIYNPKDPKGKLASSANADVFDALDCRSDRCRYGHQLWAGLVVLRNSVDSQRFINQWLTLCKNSELLTGDKQRSANFPEFRSHTHDQALLSVLAAKKQDEVAFIPMDANFFRYVLMHRRKNNEISLLGHISIQYYYIERKLLNAKLSQKLQRYLVEILKRPAKKTN